jgi:hypothetical protein
MPTKKKYSFKQGSLWGDNSLKVGTLWGSDAKLKNIWYPKEGKK